MNESLAELELKTVKETIFGSNWSVPILVETKEDEKFFTTTLNGQIIDRVYKEWLSFMTVSYTHLRKSPLILAVHLYRWKI